MSSSLLLVLDFRYGQHDPGDKWLVQTSSLIYYVRIPLACMMRSDDARFLFILQWGVMGRTYCILVEYACKVAGQTLGWIDWACELVE